MSGVVKAGELGKAPASSAESATLPLPAERAALDGAGALEALSPDAPGGGGESLQACWCATYCQQKGQGCLAECDYDSGDCWCEGKCR
ncbi:MAG TPA: hypothetical protein VNO30_47775 [Kofleriaceae bacterium]|nr:hypothetical protein [Kofleriaceae bacterium]